MSHKGHGHMKVGIIYKEKQWHLINTIVKLQTWHH